MLVFLGTARRLRAQLFQEPFLVLWLSKQNYSQVYPRSIFYTLGIFEDLDHRGRQRERKSVVLWTVVPSQPSTRYQQERISVWMAYRNLAASFSWRVLGPVKVWDSKRAQQHLLHPAPTLYMSGDLVAYTVCFEGFGKDNHFSILFTEQTSLQWPES